MASTLENLRLEKRRSMRDVSRELDIPLNSLFRMEKGEQAITLEYARKFATFYGVSIDYIADFKGIGSEKVITIEKPTTYMNILSGLDNLTDDQLVSVENIIHDYILPKRAKGKDNGPQAGKEGTKKEGSTEGKTVRS